MGFVGKTGGAGSLIGAASMLPLIAWARESGESPVLDKMVTGLFDAYPHICFATGDFGKHQHKDAVMARRYPLFQIDVGEQLA
ncbi:hypothetical protein [Sphingomonas sp. 10B4]|uniref:hypothetical protein n=1 Tax=Sphingomonas sp. 10B4 TaxID=3048575 RepID=UPI002AB4598A|nr:hypothetical protein [Sphingomonas sp. 10B4]MDY7526280.1 hypothetical protein [Sphingomonas sp. 10B4]MEB0283940.1 hypothetical protein [Sphingomonas sp. 10B4]